GWLTYGSASTQGMLWQSSVEITELQQPVIVEKLAIRVDSQGPGEFQGGPGSSVILTAHSTPLRLILSSGSHDNPPPGVRGGGNGACTMLWKEDRDGVRTAIPIYSDFVLQVGERLIAEGCGGGGYGSPTRRDSEKVRADVREGLISPEYARVHYGLKA